MDHAEFAQQ